MKLPIAFAQLASAISLAAGAGTDAASSHLVSRRPRRLDSELPYRCDDDDAKEIQALLSSKNYKDIDGVACACDGSSEAPDVAVCDIPRFDECEVYDCDAGWACTDSSEASVTVCEAVKVEEYWKITPPSEWSRQLVVDSRHFRKGVSNIDSRTVELDRTTDPATCRGYRVDGQVCASCEICDDGSVVADCADVVEGAASTCEDGGFLKRLLVLDSSATGAPTVSPTPAPTVSPTPAPTEAAPTPPSSGSLVSGIGALIWAVLASTVLSV